MSDDGSRDKGESERSPERDGKAPPERGDDSYRRVLVEGTAIGIQFAVSIGIGAWAGQWLDEQLDTDPWLLIAGVVLGAAAAFRDLFRLARRYSDED